MQRVAFGQISLTAAPPRERDLPVISNISVAAKFGPEDIVSSEGTWPQLDLGERVLVTVADEDGQIIAQAHGVVSVGFTDKEVEGMVCTIREQKIKL